jgi:hypothetical protein
VSKKLFAAGALVAGFWASDAQACRVPIYPDATFYGMIISPPPGCKDCGRRFVVLDPKTNEPIRVIQLSQLALACYSPNGAVGEIGTLNVRGATAAKELMQHSFLVGQKAPVSEQWYTKPKP